MKLIAGTDKGLIIYKKERKSWVLQDIAFIGMPIGAFHQDVSGRWWVAINHKHWGPKLYISENIGENFIEVPTPKFNDPNKILKSIWTITSNESIETNDIYIGTEPAGVFRTANLAKDFEELRGISEHPSRSSWQGGGKGSKSPFLHTIVFNGKETNDLLVGISCAGVFKSRDAGCSWQPSNTGLDAFFLPNSKVEVGHDPHSIVRHQKHPDVIWQQNHCGIFRSLDNGDSWQNLSDVSGKILYGFDLVIGDEDIDTAWVIPAQSDDQRFPNQAKLEVFKTNDAGKNWVSKSIGLPAPPCFDLVLRDGFDKKEDTMAFGTNNGNIYISEDLSESWSILSQNLSTIRTLKLL